MDGELEGVIGDQRAIVYGTANGRRSELLQITPEQLEDSTSAAQMGVLRTEA
jgi:hypothetical protein